jgi:hypothetical protein
LLRPPSCIVIPSAARNLLGALMTRPVIAKSVATKQSHPTVHGPTHRSRHSKRNEESAQSTPDLRPVIARSAATKQSHPTAHARNPRSRHSERSEESARSAHDPPRHCEERSDEAISPHRTRSHPARVIPSAARNLLGALMTRPVIARSVATKQSRPAVHARNPPRVILSAAKDLLHRPCPSSRVR